jgi:hypothetical protein
VSTILQDEWNGFGQAALAFLNRFALAIGSGNLRATRNLPFPVVFNNCRKFITDDVPPQVYNGLSKVTTILTQGEHGFLGPKLIHSPARSWQHQPMPPEKIDPAVGTRQLLAFPTSVESVESV